MLTVYVVSDSTGNTADRVVRAALVQFAGGAPVRRRTHVRSVEQIRSIVQEAAGSRSFVVHTLASAELRSAMLTEARRAGLDTMDLLGPLLDRLSVHFAAAPLGTPGLLEHLAEARSKETDALHFAFRHDDGQRPEDIPQAEIVLAGISRSMKTPVALYLASRGWRTANVPLVPGIPPPEELFLAAPERVFCLEADPQRLQEVRRTRAKYLKLPDFSYSSLSHIDEELRNAQQLCSRHRWRAVQTTGKSVEEISLEITTLLGAEPLS